MSLLSVSNNISSKNSYSEVSKTHAEYGFLRFSLWLKRVCGINLPIERKYLALSKLNELLKQHQNFANLTNFLEQNPKNPLVYQVIEAMTTNETMWFRDGYPFILLRDFILPNLKQPTFKVWSAASSSGQEAYSIAITIWQYLQSERINLSANILATDISRNMLNQGISGIYSQIELKRGLEQNYLMQYFDKLNSNYWQIKAHLRKMVEFKYLNLIDNFAGIGSFDVIFCRNFMIYLDLTNKNLLLNKLRLSLKTGGYLILGASESLNSNQLSEQFKLINCNSNIIYQAI